MTGDGIIEGFERRRLPGHGVEIDALVGGSGPPVLLLHGYPQTRMTWKRVAPELARRFTVVAPDLRGYGRSDKPEGDEAHHAYSKRTMALDAIAVMRALGHDRFAVAGHDRGGRVAYRLALDHPGAVERIAVLDIVPTGDKWAATDARAAMGAYHWTMLAQPRPLPERLVGGDPEFYLRWTLRTWAARGFAFDPECLEDYVRCGADPAAVHAACEDYRAGWGPDREADEADRGRNRIAAPLLALWGEAYSVARSDPVRVWSDWAEDVRGQAIPGGHFQADEAPEETARALLGFLGAA